MGEHHVGDVLGRDAVGGQVGEEGAAVEGVAVDAAHAAVDQHHAVGGAHDEAAERQLELVVARQELAMGQPGVGRHVQERIADREPRHAVEHGQDLELPHLHGREP